MWFIEFMAALILLPVALLLLLLAVNWASVLPWSNLIPREPEFWWTLGAVLLWLALGVAWQCWRDRRRRS